MMPDIFGEPPESSSGESASLPPVETDAPPSESTSRVDPVQSAPQVNVEDLTLAELIGRFWRAPAETWDALAQVTRTPLQSPTGAPRLRAASLPNARQRIAPPTRLLTPEEQRVRQREAALLGLRLVALLLALYGSSILASERIERFGLDVGAPYLLAAFAVWLMTELISGWPSLKVWWEERRNKTKTDDRRDVGSSDLGLLSEASRDADVTPFGRWGLRLMLVVTGSLFSALTAALTVNNRFTVGGVLAWFVSIVLWVAVFAPDGWSPGALWQTIRGIRIPRTTTMYLLVVIIALGAYFRFADLSAVPAEMTSDHVEKILDAQSVLDGVPQVFFPNNGGREPIQFYLMAAFSQLPGLGMNFTTLKLLSVLEGILTIPILWWMGRELVGEDEPELGNVVGLLLAALVAVSYWHVTLSRLALRIVLTPLFTALVLIFLSRALRHNRRGDFIKAGLVLGFGLYAYQAVRMLPLVVILGVGLAVVFKARSWRERGQYVWNVAVLAFVALVVFVPLLVFWTQFPNDFWRRTQGRLLGDDLIVTTDEQGNLVERHATLEERVEAFQKNVPILMDNIRNALLMYNWKGDVAWINGAPNRPAMDVMTGSLLIIGLAAWLGRMIRRRDAVDWLVLPMLFIMLLPSALSIAYPIENPSATRTSGSLPEAYLLAAVPLALMVISVRRLLAPAGRYVAAGIGAIVVLVAMSSNWTTYFGEYAESYLNASPAPYTEVGAYLRGFADSGGGYGNAFMIAYPYWWDHRAMGIEAGLLDWPNGIITRDQLPQFIYESATRLEDDPYRFDPNKDMIVFYSVDDAETETALQTWFPDGRIQHIQSYKPGDDYNVYRVPALGTDGFIDFAIRAGATS